MKNNILAGIISGFIAGITILLIDKLMIPKDVDIVIENFGLIGTSLIIGIFIAIMYSLMKNNEDSIFENLSFKSITFSVLIVFSFFIYQIFPSYYNYVITNGVIKKFQEVDDAKKVSALKYINENFIDRIMPFSYSSSQTLILTKTVMKEHPFLLLLASIHPDSTTSHMIMKATVFLNLSIEYQNDGIYLLNNCENNIKIFSKFKYKAFDDKNYLFIKIDLAKKIMKTKFGDKDYLGGQVCPLKEDYLLVSMNKKCEPVTNKILLQFLSKPLDELWRLKISSLEKTLLSPENFIEKKNLMSGILEMALQGSGGKVVGLGEKFILVFTYKDNTYQVKMITSFKLKGNENWLIIDDEIILQPTNINNFYTDGYYYTVYHLNKNQIKELLKGSELAFKFKSENSDKYRKHKLSLEYFDVAYKAFDKND